MEKFSIDVNMHPRDQDKKSMEGLVLEQYLVSQMMVIAYLLGCESTGEAVVVDPAADADRILDDADRLGLRVTRIINTHGHVDHIMGNRVMQAKTGAPIVIHEADAVLMTNQSPEMFQMFGGQPSPPADETVRDKETVTFGDVSLEVIHTPGHTPGSVCLRVPGAILTGDTLFVGGIGRTDLPGGSLPTLLSSIRNRLLTLPGKTRVYPGHGYGPTPASTIEGERESNPFLNEKTFY